MPLTVPRILLSSVLVLASLSPSVGADAQTPAAKGYEETAPAPGHCITHELSDRRVPALSIALVDDQRIVWARGFGFSDPKAKKPATADTVYRVGSVSKLFTDIAVMQLVEQGKLDLDAPVANYLPDFK